MQFSIRPIRRRPGAEHRTAVDIGDQLARQGRWIALVSQQTGQGKRVRLYLKFKPLAISLLILMAVGYAGSALALTLWLDRRPHNLVTFWDVSLPWRWSGLDELRGEGYGHRGLELLNDEAYQQGIFFLQRSFSMKPDNESGRLALAELYAKSNYYEGVRRTLEPQLEIRFSRPVAELLIAQSFSSDDLPYLAAKAGELRSRYELSDEDRLWLVDAQAQALLTMEQFDLALAVLQGVENPNFRLKNRLVQAFIGLERLEEAQQVTETIAPALPGMEKIRAKLEAMVGSAAGRIGPTEAILREIVADRPSELGSWLFGIETLSHGNMDTQAERWVGDYLTRFAARPGALAQLFNRVVSSKNTDLIRYTARRIAEWNPLPPEQRIIFALVLLDAGNWEALVEEFPEAMDPELPTTDWRSLIRAAVLAARSDDPPELLEAILNRAPPRLIYARSAASGFAKSERWDLVKMVVDAGLLGSKHSVSLRNYRSQAEEALAEVVDEDIAGDAAAAVAMTFTEKDAPRLEWELKQAVQAEAWDEVETKVLRIRRQNPVWLERILPTMDWAAAHVAAARSDYERLRVLAPAVLRNDGELAGWFTDQAVAASENGYEGSAIRLLEVILEEERYYHRARAILKELTAEPEPESAALEFESPEN